jgi:hypothetical protein
MCPDYQPITMTANPPYLTRRQRPSGENHHLWSNHGTWWFHGTVHLPDHTSVRCRCNLKTGDPAVARQKRDRILSRPAVIHSIAHA